MLTSFAALKISQNLFLKDDVIISFIYRADKNDFWLILFIHYLCPQFVIS